MSFKTVGHEISEKEKVPLNEAYAMLAKSGRNSSKLAKHKNPNLKKIPGA